MKKVLSPGRKGFTLIEMLIVIGIIGILAVGLGRLIVGGPAKARDATRKQALSNVLQAIETFNINKGVYPSPSSGQWMCVENIETANPGFKDAFAREQVPLDPSQDPAKAAAISYANTAAGTTPACKSYLYVKAANGQPFSYMVYARMEDDSQGNVAVGEIKTDGTEPTVDQRAGGQYYVIIQ